MKRDHALIHALQQEPGFPTQPWHLPLRYPPCTTDHHFPVFTENRKKSNRVRRKLPKSHIPRPVSPPEDQTFGPRRSPACAGRDARINGGFAGPRRGRTRRRFSRSFASTVLRSGGAVWNCGVIYGARVGLLVRCRWAVCAWAGPWALQSATRDSRTTDKSDFRSGKAMATGTPSFSAIVFLIFM